MALTELFQQAPVRFMRCISGFRCG